MVKPLAPHLNALRAHNSAYEIGWMRAAGALHAEVMESVMPELMREGMSEAELCGAVYLELLKRGSMGICRYNQPIGEDVCGFSGFGENTVDALAFDGPDGCAGTCIAVQAIGSPARMLRRGDLVLMDMPAGLLGYHTDKWVYYYGTLKDDPNAALIREAYDLCASIERWAAARLVPGAIPEDLFWKLRRWCRTSFRKASWAAAVLVIRSA